MNNESLQLAIEWVKKNYPQYEDVPDENLRDRGAGGLLLAFHAGYLAAEEARCLTAELENWRVKNEL